MTPLYIVDAYNFLHAVLLKGLPRDNFWSQQNQDVLVRYFAPKRERVLLVLDDSSAPRETTRDEAEFLVRAPDADEEILRLVTDGALHHPSQSQGAPPIVVVTADRSLADKVKNTGTPVMSPWALAEAFLDAP